MFVGDHDAEFDRKERHVTQHRRDVEVCTDDEVQFPREKTCEAVACSARVLEPTVWGTLS